MYFAVCNSIMEFLKGGCRLGTNGHNTTVITINIGGPFNWNAKHAAFELQSFHQLNSTTIFW